MVITSYILVLILRNMVIQWFSCTAMTVQVMVTFLSVMYYNNSASRSVATDPKCGLEIFLCSAQKTIHICYLKFLSWPCTLAHPDHSNNGIVHNTHSYVV